MDIILLKRLRTFANSIKEHQAKASELCACRPWEGNEVEQAAIIASKLQSTLGKFQSDLYQYFNTSTDPNPDEVSTLTEIQLQGEEILAELNARIQSIKEQGQVKSDPVKNRSKLPELELVSFHGNVLEWTQFWDQFSSNIDQRNLRDVDKFLYLKASLKGEAKIIIDGLETTNENYKIAVDTLKERYGNRIQIIDAHYSSLYKVKKAMKPQDCRKTLDELERHLRVLQSLGEDTNKNNLRFLFMEKFPEDVIYELKLKLKTESTEEIRKQLNAIITAKEDVDRINAEDKNIEPTFTTETLHVKINKVKDNNKHLKKFTGERKFKNEYNMKPKGKPIKTEPGTSTFSSVDRRKRPYEANNESRNQYPPKKRDRKDCIFCHGDHFNDSCPRFTTLAERKGKLSDRCFICFKYGHRQNTCRTTHVCHYCGARNRHNRALCPDKELQNTTTTST
ncbi:uncharacterized protein LOC125224765 [Leguminivora glycinivorella]|uniref:uncharacterized protein LOC125224765 n=1 Tax=Leguminivora glycinivorella TaxID=1035111 RepID=UPI00200FE5F6|nr:uncharacterized protein LOC125224765 [Leguminivora glycinivorella]